VPISSGVIIVWQAFGTGTATGAKNGAGSFSYVVVGEYYRWYEAPFVGLNFPIYVLFLISCALALFTVVTAPGGLMLMCCGCAGFFCCCISCFVLRGRNAGGVKSKPKK